jgi:signal transduction histidine kinase/HAMP domain-containing protein
MLTRIETQLGRADDLFRSWEARSLQFVQRVEAGHPEEASEREPLIRDGTALADEIDTLGRLINGRVDDLTRATEAAQSRAAAVSASLAALALVLGSGLIVAILHALRPIARLTSQVQRLAGGDYSSRVEAHGDDEIALLAVEFNAMVAALQTRDRTLVERAEQLNRISRHLESVLDSLEDGLLVVEDGLVTRSNAAATRIWGASLDTPPPPALAPISRVAGRHEVAGAGSSLHEVRVTPFGDQGFVVIAVDVTDQTHTRERLARSERLALIGQMLAQITHEVRNPLNALSLNAALLADELQELDPSRGTEAWEILGTVAQEIERLTAVTAHYLQLARRPKAALGPEDVGLLIDDVSRLLLAELSHKGVQLAISQVALAPQLVDGNQIKQALLNVIRNAVEAGAGRIALELEHHAGEIRIVVTDDGRGMSADEVEKACEPFFSSKATGTGLGLAITKQILEDHDGTVRVLSSPGAGTAVVLTLPERPATAYRSEDVAADQRSRR